MHKPFIVIATIALSVSLSAHAQQEGGVRYRWHDGSGLLHYSDSLSAEAMKYGYDLVNNQGLVVQHVQRQLTPEERAAANKLAADEAAKQRAQKEQEQADQQMLAAYPNEASFTTYLQDKLDSIDQQIATTKINMRSQEKALTDLLGRAGDFERAKKPVPRALGNSISDQRNVVAGQRALLEHLQQSRTTTEQDNAAQLARYRALRAAQARENSQSE
jgi:hypothetical protein